MSSNISPYMCGIQLELVARGCVVMTMQESTRIISCSSYMSQVIHLCCVLFLTRGCLTQEKVVASCAKTFAVIADDRLVRGCAVGKGSSSSSFINVSLPNI